MNCMSCGNALGAGVSFCPRCGTPAAQPDPFRPPPGQARASWGGQPAAAAPRRKSRAGKILLVVFGVLLVLMAGAGVAIYLGVRYVADSVKSSEPYRVAEKELRESPVAAGALGEIKSTGFPLGSFGTEAGGSGQAAFTMSVEGTKGSGQYVAVLTREGGAWRMTSGVIRMSGGEVVNLVGGDSETLEGAGEADEAGVLPPPPAPPGARAPAPTNLPKVSGGVLNGKAVSKPAPAYPPAARAVRASGTVTVQVTVDEGGDVVEAKAVGGHPLLRAAAEAAARQAKLTPTLLSGRPVKVSGTLTYDFAAQ